MVGYSYHFWHGGMKNEVTQLYRYHIDGYRTIYGSYYAMEWYKGKSSAQQLTEEEIKSLNNIQHNQLSHETPVTSQVPSSQTEHKEGEKGSDVTYTENKKVFYILGADDATLKKGLECSLVM